MILQDLAEAAVDAARDAGCQYCDARAEEYTEETVSVDGGEIRHHLLSDAGIGIRVLKDGAWSFVSVSRPDGRSVIIEAARRAVRNAACVAMHRTTPTTLADVPVAAKVVSYPVRVPPNLDEVCEIGQQCVSNAMEADPSVRRARTKISWKSTKKAFLSSDGSNIVQEFTDTVGETVVVARDSGITQSISVSEGGKGGLEQVSGGDILLERSRDGTATAARLVRARPAKGSEEATVVLNPDFASLLVHEILGHPSEADRVAGGELAWAGGAWWAGMVGQKIGSGHLTVFDDPTIDGSLGQYRYDDEGVRSSKTVLVNGGILEGHLHSRETAVRFDAEPTANMRASSYRHMPLIRMACTCIDGGDFGLEEMISDVRSGYLISDMKVPSIDMYRYNWSMSCQYANRIEDGQICELVRDVIVMGTSPRFFGSIEACGRDLAVRPITNCGKGDPMQQMAVGNGGPSIKGVATVKSSEP